MPYTAVPSRRLAWDDDGTVVQGRDATTHTAATTPAQPDGVPPVVPYQTISPEAKEAMQSENPVTIMGSTASTGVGIDRYTIANLIFPEPREIDGYYWQGGNVQQNWLYYSQDSRTGRDGSWSPLGSQVLRSSGASLEDYRESIVSSALSNVQSVTAFHRSQSGAWIRRLHYYGEITPGETPDRLLFIDEDTSLEFVLPVDFGDVPRGSAREWEFRLFNNSTVGGNNVTLNTIQFTTEGLFRGSEAWYQFSLGGDAFQATKQITSLAPQAASSLITGRQIIPVNAGLGLHAARIKASVASLS